MFSDGFCEFLMIFVKVFSCLVGGLHFLWVIFVALPFSAF